MFGYILEYVFTAYVYLHDSFQGGTNSSMLCKRNGIFVIKKTNNSFQHLDYTVTSYGRFDTELKKAITISKDALLE